MTLQILITLIALAFSYGVARLIFPSNNKNKIKYMPRPQPSQVTFTTDLVVTDYTKWFTHSEFFGRKH